MCTRSRLVEVARSLAEQTRVEEEEGLVHTRLQRGAYGSSDDEEVGSCCCQRMTSMRFIASRYELYQHDQTCALAIIATESDNIPHPSQQSDEHFHQSWPGRFLDSFACLPSVTHQYEHPCSDTGTTTVDGDSACTTGGVPRDNDEVSKKRSSLLG
jgi:hypothetical protein